MKRISIVFVLISVLLVLSACGKSEFEKERFTVKAGETFSVTVSMADSGAIKSMALSLYFDDNAFELINGKWLNQNAVIADFNMQTKDAAIAFEDDIDYCGEIFKFSLRAKENLVIIDDMIIVEPVLKNEQVTLECEGIDLVYAK